MFRHARFSSGGEQCPYSAGRVRQTWCSAKPLGQSAVHVCRLGARCGAPTQRHPSEAWRIWTSVVHRHA